MLFWTLEQNILSLCPIIAFNTKFTLLQPLQHTSTYSSQLLCEENVNRKSKTRPRIFYFAFGSMLKVLDSYFVKQRDSATDGRISSNGEWIRRCYDASLIHCLKIGILVLFHANIRINKISSVSFFLSITLIFTYKIVN